MWLDSPLLVAANDVTFRDVSMEVTAIILWYKSPDSWTNLLCFSWTYPRDDVDATLRKYRKNDVTFLVVLVTKLRRRIYDVVWRRVSNVKNGLR